jgi:predicted MFS family arabinose efflux permease
MVLALVIAGLVLISLTHLHSLSLALVLSMMMGSCTTTMNVMFVTTLQTQAPMRLLGRVFTTFSTTAQAATPIGMLTAGYLLDAIGVGKTLSVFGLILLLVSLSVFALKPMRAGRTPQAA